MMKFAITAANYPGVEALLAAAGNKTLENNDSEQTDKRPIGTY